MRENELTQHVFQDTGRSVLIRKVSPFLMSEIARSFPPPQPPLQEVDYGDGPVLEPNPAHPDYERAMQEYNMSLEEKVRRMMIRRGVVIQWDDEKRAEVQQLRDEWREEFGTELSGSDELIYVSHICIGTGEDFGELIEAIQQRSHPTGPEVELARSGFRG